MKIVSLVLFLILAAISNYSQACDQFKPKGKLLRTGSTIWYTDARGIQENLAVIFRAYDEDGDDRADVETASRMYRDTGEETFPFLYFYGKDVPLENMGGKTVYTLDREYEYADIDATGICENIHLSWKKSDTIVEPKPKEWDL